MTVGGACGGLAQWWRRGDCSGGVPQWAAAVGDGGCIGVGRTGGGDVGVGEPAKGVSGWRQEAPAVGASGRRQRGVADPTTAATDEPNGSSHI
jgi:hypothetical protein